MADLSKRLAALERRRRLSPSPSSPAAPNGGRPLTGEELAQRLGVTGETVRRWAGQGMPSCGRHPSRPTWPVYDEGACRAWAAANQPQTALRPPTGDGAGAAPAADKRASLAGLRARRLYLQCQMMRERLIQERAEHLEAEDCRAVWKRHADAVRAKFDALPARTAGRLAAALGLGEESEERFRAILAAGMERVSAELSDDPLMDAALVQETRHGR